MHHHVVYRRRRHTWLGAIALATAFSSCGGARAAEFDGSATLRTDYVWRGVSQTNGGPAAQAGVRISGTQGFHGSAWTSNVDFAPGARASREVDLALGWAGSVSRDWILDVSVLRYGYPSSSPGLDWTEVDGTLSYADRYWLSAGWSPHALGGKRAGTYAEAGAKFPLREGVRIEAAIGRYALANAGGGGYLHGQAGIAWAVAGPVELRLTAHATGSRAKRIFGGDVAGSRIEVALQAAF